MMMSDPIPCADSANCALAAAASTPSWYHAHHSSSSQDCEVRPSESDYYRTAAASLSNSGAYQHLLDQPARAVKLYQEACGVREEALKIDARLQQQQQQQQYQKNNLAPSKPGQAASASSHGGMDDKAKERRLEGWVSRVLTEEGRLRSLAAERRRSRPSSPALDLYHAEVEDRPAPEDGSSEDGLFDWSLGSDPLCIVHPKPLPSPASSGIGSQANSVADADAVAIREQQDYVDSCKTLFNMGLVHLRRGHADVQAHDIFRMALSVLPPQADPTLHAHLLNHLALTQARTGRDGGAAVSTLNGALRFEQQHFNSISLGSAIPTTSPSSQLEDVPPTRALDVATCVSDTLSLLARTHRARGERDRAAEIAAECLRIRTARLGGGDGDGDGDDSCKDEGAKITVHPDVACGWYNLGLVLVEAGRAGQGMAYLDSFVDWVEASFGDRSPVQGQQQQGRQGQGQQQQQQQQTTSPPPPPFPIDPKVADQLSWALHTVALYHLDLCSSVTRALSLLNSSLNLRRTHVGQTDPTVALTLHTLGRLYSDVGSVREAMVCYRESIHILRSTMGPDHSDVAAVLCDVGRLHHERGEVDEALASYAEALRIAKIELVAVEEWRIGRSSQGQSPNNNPNDNDHQEEYEEEDDDGPTEESIAELLRIVGNVQLERGDSAGAMSSFAEAERMVIRSSNASASALAASSHALQQQQPPGQPMPSTNNIIVVPITDPNGRGVNFHPCAAAA